MSNESQPDFEKLIGLAFVEALRKALRKELRLALAAIEPKPPRLSYTLEEAAKMLGVPETWLASRAREGAIQSRRMGRYVNFTLRDLEEFAQKGWTSKNSDGISEPSEETTDVDQKNQGRHLRGIHSAR